MPTMDAIKGYRRVERIVHDLDGYELVFRYFERHDWRGGAPRLGEEFLSPLLLSYLRLFDFLLTFLLAERSLRTILDSKS